MWSQKSGISGSVSSMTIDNLLSGKKVDALGLLNAQLELRFELMRAVTPKYSVYKYSKSPSFESSTTRLLQRWKHIDANSVPRASGLTRQEAVRKLHEWHDTGAIELQLSVVVHRFHALRHLVRVSGTKLNATVSESIYVQIEERKREEGPAADPERHRSRQLAELYQSVGRT